MLFNCSGNCWKWFGKCLEHVCKNLKLIDCVFDLFWKLLKNVGKVWDCCLELVGKHVLLNVFGFVLEIVWKVVDVFWIWLEMC